MNHIYCPYKGGYAERISKSKKTHTCRECKHKIDKGSSYVSVHLKIDTFSWVSDALCDDCYAIAFEKAFNFTPLTKTVPEGIEVVYRTLDGEVFDTVHEAEGHNAKAAEYCLMYDAEGRTTNIEDAIVLKIQNSTGMRYFVNACKRYMAEHPSSRDISGGLIKDYTEDPDLYDNISPLYLWNDGDYIYVDDTQEKALANYLNGAGTAALPITADELNHLINDTIAYIWTMEKRSSTDETSPGYQSRKVLLEKLRAFEREHFPQCDTCD